MDSYIIAFYEADYADEFYVRGAWFTTQAEFDKHMKRAKKVFDREEELAKLKYDSLPETNYKKKYNYGPEVGIDIRFGTNEAITYTSFEAYQNCFEVKRSSKEVNDAVTMVRAVRSPVIGTICFVRGEQDY